MGDNEHGREHTHQPVEDHRQVTAEGLEPEGVEPEDASGADVSELLDQGPDEQLSRPDQPDFSEEERRPFEEPPEER